MKKDINVKEKRTDFLSMWRDFWNPMPEEETQEEEILGYNKISDADKKEMLRTLKSVEKASNEFFRNSYKTSKLKVDSEESLKKTLKQKNNMTKPNTKVINNSQRENEERENSI